MKTGNERDDWFERSREQLRVAYRGGQVEPAQAQRLAIYLGVLERIGSDAYDEHTWHERREALLEVGVDIDHVRGLGH